MTVTVTVCAHVQTEDVVVGRDVVLPCPVPQVEVVEVLVVLVEV